VSVNVAAAAVAAAAATRLAAVARATANFRLVIGSLLPSFETAPENSRAKISSSTTISAQPRLCLYATKTRPDSANRRRFEFEVRTGRPIALKWLDRRGSAEGVAADEDRLRGPAHVAGDPLADGRGLDPVGIVRQIG
jgi:hypothetical protein